MKPKNVAVITGGASGIGLAIVKELIENEVFPIVLDIIPMTNQFSNEFGTSVEYYQCDLFDEVQLISTLDKIILRHDQIDYIINNAAIQYIEPFEKILLSHWDQTMTVNLRSPLIIIKKLKSRLRENSHIINITSVHGEKPRTEKFAYDASKAALNLMTKELALDFAKNKILVNAISCGATNTPMNNHFSDKEVLKSSIAKIPLGRVASPEEIARFTCYILLKTSYITGQVLTIDGGRSINN